MYLGRSFTIFSGHLDVMKFFVESKVNLEPRDAKEDTPLHNAAWNGQIKIVKYLVQLDVSKEPKDTFGNTPLHEAAMCGQLEMVKILMDLDIDKEPRNYGLKTPLHYAAQGQCCQLWIIFMQKTNLLFFESHLSKV